LVKLGGNVAQSTSLWNFTTTTNLTFNKNSANIEVLASSTPFNGLFFTPGTTNPTAFNTLTFDALTSPCMLSWSGGNTTIATLVVNPGWSITFASAGAVTVQNPFNWVGTPTLPIGLTTLGPVNATINCGSAALSTLKWGVIGGVNGGGAGATFRADNSLAVGQTNWSVFQPIDAALLPAQVATAVWQDLLSSSDFSTSASVGALVKAMSNLQFTVPAMARGTVGASSSVTSVVTSALDPPGAALDQFKNGVVVFDKATTTAALRGQRGLISGSSNVAAPILTVAAPGLTTAPVSGDTFTVV
jgi:hypothetical protein